MVQPNKQTLILLSGNWFTTTMLGQINYDGKWWLPNKPDYVFLGSLSFNQQKGAILSLIGSFDQIGDKISEHEIILGELSDGQKITLDRVSSTYEYSYLDFRKSSIEVQRIFLGAHFLRSEDIKFDSIIVTFSNLDKWIDFNDIHGRFFSTENGKSISMTYEKCDPIKIKITNKYQINIVAKPEGHLPTPQLWEGYITEKRCIELKSLIEKSFDEYINLYGIIQNFLNFIIPNEVLVESIEGIAEAHKSDPYIHNHSIKQQHIQIFYKSPIFKMMKPKAKSQPLLPFQELQDSNQLENYLIKWFEISEKFKPVFDLYFGVMYSPEMYSEFQFLGLAQALESYHGIKSSQKRKWLMERAKELFENYLDIATVYFKFADRETFATKVKDTRNYFSHGSEDLESKSVQEKDLRSLTEDLQLLLELCLMTQLDFDNDRIKKIFHVDKIRK